MGSDHPMTWRDVFLILAILLFFLAGIGGLAAPEWPWRQRLMCWGLFCWAVSTVHIAF